MNPKLLIIDDDEEIRSQLKWALADYYEVLEAQDRESALRTFRESRPLVILLDLGLPPRVGAPDEGMAALEEILAVDSLTQVIIVSGQSDRENALAAIGRGACDFMSKPVEMEELRVILKRAFHVAHLEREYRDLQHQRDIDGMEGILGTSSKMQVVFNSIRKVATADVPVLILGESGTGKEMTALAIHRRSNRKDGPFIAINCAAIPETLLESELFGHEKGAFTGAHAQRKGRIETANGGTLFLDEIGEIPPGLQVKLLRFLQEQAIERVGGRSLVQLDVRVLAATNADLKKAMTENRFREDLYFRLAVVVLNLPPLRERDGDGLLLAKGFLQQLSSQPGRKRLELGAPAIRAIQRHSWPGNVRELQNRIKRAVIMTEGKTIRPEDLELGQDADGGTGRTLKAAREVLEREMIERALRRHAGRISRAAEELDISRPTLYELMEKLGMNREQFDKAGENSNSLRP